MKSIKKLRTKFAVIGVMAAAMLVIPAASVFAGYTPANRPTYQCITPSNCPGADHVTFNSFTNAPNYGDERAFFDGKDASITGPGGYQDKLSGLKDGQKLVLRVYIHNNANPNAIGVDAATAHNTQLKVLLPKNEAATNVALATISASNANPGTVGDSVNFSSANPFTMEFDKSSPVQVTYRPNGQGDFVTRTLQSASFVSDQDMHADLGDFHGCFNFSELVTMTVVIHEKTTPPPESSGICKLLSLTVVNKDDREVQASVTGEVNNATIIGYSLNFGDGTTVAQQTANHKYAKDGTYSIVGSVQVKLANGQTVTKTADSCEGQVTFTPNQPPKVTPPPSTPPTPSSLPNTGPGNVIAAFFGVTSISSIIYYAVSRRLSKLF